jgi:hypothetical protein
MHAAPRWRDVAIEQIRAVGIHVRSVGALLIGSMVIYGAVVVRVAVNAHNAKLEHRLYATSSFAYTPQISILIAYLGLLLPALMWHDESPVRRMYHLAMPVDRSTHALTKAFAGWVWLMAGTVVFVLCIVVVNIIAKQVGGPPPRIAVIFAWEWLVPFAAVTIAYVFASAAAIGAQTPAVWIVGPPVLYAGAAFAIALLGYQATAQSMFKLFSGYYGASTAMGGWVDEINPGASHAVGSASPERWLGASLIWGVTAAVLLIVVARRKGALK